MMDAEKEDFPRHFNQEPRRKAEILRPPNTLKAKVGSGGSVTPFLIRRRHCWKTTSSISSRWLTCIYKP